MNIEVLIADYSNSVHAADFVELLNCYACDPMGGGKPLTEYAKENLALELDKLPGAFSILCYVDGAAAGLANCLTSFSTFKCKPLVNIHDIFVLKQFRGLGLSKRLLNEVQRVAMERDCCKLTLEVLEGNEPAKKAYLSFGFEGYELDSSHGKALFWQKTI